VASKNPTPSHNIGVSEIALKEEGGGFSVPVVINDTLSLRFLIDSGAADVSIPADVVSTLVRTGTVSENDFIGTQTFSLADGSTVPSTEFRIKSLRVGTLTLHDVKASLASPRGPLLLGQTFLKRLSGWSIDNDKGVLIIGLGNAPGKNHSQFSNFNNSGNAENKPNESDAHDNLQSNTDPSGTLKEAALSRAMQFFATSSNIRPDNIDSLREFYAPELKYYGSFKNKDYVISEKSKFILRWPKRSYIPRESDSQVMCNSQNYCTVSGLVDWQTENEIEHRSSSGTASFWLTFRGDMITSENSKVVSRSAQ
jgi:clan AA aspartic protease (TIGR02281 family)